MRKQGEVSIWKILDASDRSLCLVDVGKWKSNIENCMSNGQMAMDIVHGFFQPCTNMLNGQSYDQSKTDYCLK